MEQERSPGPEDMLPDDWQEGLFLGRIDFGGGPIPILIRHGAVYDMSRVAPTVSALIEQREFAGAEILGGPEVLEKGKLLSPIDLQCVKAAGVTFAGSALERIVEERARGKHAEAAAIHERLESNLGGTIRSVRPGSPEATALKDQLIAEGFGSHYLEVAIGPDAELFTKAPVLSTVGTGAGIGVRADSSRASPEPEIVLVADRNGVAIGATLGNDLSLRDIEDRSALLMDMAKDNNASCSLGPFIRIFDRFNTYTMDDLRAAEVTMRITGLEGFILESRGSMQDIIRDPEELLRQALSEHQYPDGFVLFCGTPFVPTEDRDEPGRGFTLKIGDTVATSSSKLGTLVNRVATCRDAPPVGLRHHGHVPRFLAARPDIGLPLPLPLYSARFQGAKDTPAGLSGRGMNSSSPGTFSNRPSRQSSRA